jgi:DNA-binding transcriptional LysR family regulator
VSFDVRQLRYFVAVAEAGSLTRAALTIPVAQQSLSEQIRALERQVGAPLFVRGPRGVQLTDVGAALLAEAKPLLTRTDRAFDRVRRLAVGERQTLHVGFLPSVANYVVPPVLRAFADAHPEIALTTEDLPIARLVEGLREGRSPWHRKYDHDFAAAGFSPNVVQRGSSVQSLLALVAAGVGVTRLPLSARTLRGTGVVFVPLRNEYADVVVAWIDDRSRPAVDALRNVIHVAASTSDLLTAG